MNPKEFLKTIYLGDRGCKCVYINGWDKQVSLKIDSISRIRDPSGLWNYYTNEDIDDGLIVFTGVTGIKFSPQWRIPNDYINYIKVSEENNGLYIFKCSISSIASLTDSMETIIKIKASGLHLEDPTRPSIKIVD